MIHRFAFLLTLSLGSLLAQVTSAGGGAWPAGGGSIVSGPASWGNIGGTLTNQADLSTALAGKVGYRGAWTSSTSYSIGDLVVANGYGYVALTANTNTPVSTASTWLWLGASGSGPSGAGASWGSISGSISAQLDLQSALSSMQSALNLKQNALTLPLPIANGGTGTATPALTAGSNISLTGSWPNYTIAASVSSTAAAWGSITGTLSSQTDLQTALNGKQNALTLPLSVANGGSGSAAPGIVAGANITVTGSWPNQTIAASGSTGVSSVGLTAPSWLSVSGSPVTGSGTLALSAGTAVANQFLATPSGATGALGLRSIVAADLPSISLTSGVSGTLPVANGGTGSTSSTGTGNNVLSNSPTLVTPILGTPASVTLTNGTGLPLTTGVTGTLPVGNGGTGVTTSTGSGNNVLSTSPTLVTPVLGTPTSVTLTNATGLPLTTGVTGTLPVANGGTGTTSPGIVAGTSISVTGTWPNQTVNSLGTVTIASGTAALGTTAIASGACATAVTVSATGVATTDTIQADFNGDPTGITGYVPSTNGILTVVKYPTSNAVNFKVCNLTGASVTPGAVTLNWKVVR